MSETPQAIEFLAGKSDELLNGMFGVNKTLPRREKLPPGDPDMVYALLDLYFTWAMGLEDEEQRRVAMAKGDFIVTDLQTPGKYLVSDKSEDYEKLYSELPVRRGSMDTTEIRKSVCGEMAKLVVGYLSPELTVTAPENSRA